MTELVERFCGQVRDLRVLVVGETIIDMFVDVAYEGQSMKSFCPVFKLQGNERRQHGGAGAIANHLRGFVAEVDVITNTNDEIVKTRYIDVYSGQKHIEINKFETADFSALAIDANAYDTVIVADFGHGFCDEIKIEGAFHLMCQTNSNNFGFNRLSKWKAYRKRSVCVDLREASLQMNKRLHKIGDDFVFDLYNYEVNAEHVFITMGAKGAKFTDGQAVSHCAAFPSEIVDTIGAGDAFFAFACLGSHLKMSPDEIMVPASLAGSLSTTWLCNEQSVTPEKMLEHASQFV